MHRPRMPKSPSCMRNSLTLWFVTSQTGDKGLSCALFRCPHQLDVAISNVPSEFPLTSASQPPLYGILPREFMSPFIWPEFCAAGSLRETRNAAENRHFDHKRIQITKSEREEEANEGRDEETQRSSAPIWEKVAPPFHQPYLCCMCAQTGRALISVFNVEDHHSSKLVSNAVAKTTAGWIASILGSHVIIYCREREMKSRERRNWFGEDSQIKWADVICGGTLKLFIRERYRGTRGVAL